MYCRLGCTVRRGITAAGMCHQPGYRCGDFVLISEEQEFTLGRQANTRILREIPVYADPELAQLVQQAGGELASHSHRPDLVYRFKVLDSSTINAFALPGGYIHITSGLPAYLNSEAELAAVLGH